MRYITLITLFITSIIANNIQEGKELYLNAKCQKCHLEGDKFDPNSIKKEGFVSKVKDYKGIHKWVVDCDIFFNVGWFPKEQDKVTEYLNATHYKFKLSKNKVSK